MLVKDLGAAEMLNRTTILQRVGVSVVANPFMVGSRTDSIREIPSDPTSRLSGQTSNSAIIPSIASREVQAYESNDSDLTGNQSPKPSTQTSSGRDNRKPKQPNLTLNRTHCSVLRPLPHAG
jgi:hypothetical protein